MANLASECGYQLELYICDTKRTASEPDMRELLADDLLVNEIGNTVAPAST